MTGAGTSHRQRGTPAWLGLLLALAALAALAVIAVAGARLENRSGPASPPPSSISPPVGPQLRAALRLWRSFPAGAATRPLVVAAPVISPARFPDAADQNAFARRAIARPRAWPASPATVNGMPVITAARALAELTGDRPRSVAATAAPPLARLPVTAVRLGTAVFGTDRGPRSLPAWRVSFRGIPDPAAVLAVAPPRTLWPAGLGRVTATGHAVATEPGPAGRAGRTLRLTFTGAEPGTGACQTSWSVRQQSSPTAVAVYLAGIEHAVPQACPAQLRTIRLTVTLPAPLGNRVLVDALTYAPIPVTGS